MATKTSLLTPAYTSTRWDIPLNANFGVVDNAFGGAYSANVASSDVTLTTAQAQNMRIIATGAPSGNRTIFIPTGVTGSWIVSNAVSTGYFVYVYNTSGSVGAQIYPGLSALVFSDGTNVYSCDTSSTTTPPGTIIAFGGGTEPAGFLACDGTAYQRAVYSNLYAAIGTTWGTTDPSNFNVPDLRGYFVRGTGTNDDGTVGPAVGGSQADTYLNHTHTATQDPHDHQYNYPSFGVTGDGGTTTNITQPAGALGYATSSATPNITVATSTTGGTETRPKNQGVLYCIKY